MARIYERCVYTQRDGIIAIIRGFVLKNSLIISSEREGEGGKKVLDFYIKRHMWIILTFLSGTFI